MCGVAKTPDEY